MRANRRSIGSGPCIHRSRSRAIAEKIELWFGRAARDLPWRTRVRNPYHALVSETMLQQTQVCRVVERYRSFIDRFPTIADLAGADEREVLALWSGLGYYRRGRNLRLAARAIVSNHGGVVPHRAADLRALPGIGRYTAGAIASIAYGQREPLVDGNVMRVLLRIEGRDLDPSSPRTRDWAWTAAGALVKGAKRPGVLNEGLMELGATVCTPRSPRCQGCPLRANCVSRREGTTGRIPRPKRGVRTQDKPVLYCASVLVPHALGGRLLVEPRNDRGMWAGLWQAPTVERADRAPTRAEAGAAAGVPARRLTAAVASFDHMTTHRAVRFDVWLAAGDTHATVLTAPNRRRWATREQIESLALSSPQQRILLDLGFAARRGGLRLTDPPRGRT